MRAPLAVAAAGTLALTACSQNDDEAITVFAAASLHEVFEEIGELYTEETGVAVEFNFAGSSGLVEQLANGAPADVLATADEATMDSAVGSGLTSADPEVFAENFLVIATPSGNPAGLSSLADLGDEAVEAVICAEQVPCGASAQRISAAAGVQISPVSEETSVTDVLGRVRNGEADAGLVYATDALQAGDEVETFQIDGAAEDPNLYPIALLENAADPAAGEAFIEFVGDEEQAQQILQDAGFADAR